MTEPENHNTASYEFTASEEASGERVDRFLTAHLPDVSRARVQRAAAAGALTVDGHPVKPNHRLHGGEAVAVALVRPEPTDEPPQPEAIPLDVVHEDSQIIVVNKPAGMVVHPAVGNRTGTLVNALLGHGAFAADSETGSGQRPGIVHRLDKGTSGLLVCARTEAAHHHLAEQIKARTLTRRYRAVSWGLLKDEITVIEKPVGRSFSDRKKMAVTRRGRPAKTTLRRLERFRLAELLEATLATGRTHQIRVHLSNLGHPIIADTDYGGGMLRLKGIDPLHRPFGRRLIEAIGRPALHAYYLALDHPRTGQRLEWTLEPPPDFQALLALCRRDAH